VGTTTCVVFLNYLTFEPDIRKSPKLNHRLYPGKRESESLIKVLLPLMKVGINDFWYSVHGIK